MKAGTSSQTGGGQFNSVEFLLNRGFQVSDVAYVRGTTFVIRFTIENPNSSAIQCTFTFGDPQLFRFVSFESEEMSGSANTTFTLAAHALQEVNVTIANVPDFVTHGHFQADWELSSSAGGQLHSGTMVTMYLPEDEPCGWMAVPWTEVLEVACMAADEQTGMVWCAIVCTRFLFETGWFEYDGTSTHWIEIDGSNAGKFNLSSFLEAGGVPKGDCQDVSSYLALCLNSLGEPCQLWETRLEDEDSSFRTNEICPIGEDPSSWGSYARTDWCFHQTTRLTITGTVFDACAGQWLDTEGQTYKTAPAHWELGEYLQTYIGDWPTGGPRFLGLIYGYSEGNPSWVHDYVDDYAFNFGVYLLQGVC